MMELERYILKIELVGSNPLIWRRIAVPSVISLDRLHDVIQIVMGWSDIHLYSFIIGDKSYMEFADVDDAQCSEYPDLNDRPAVRYRLNELIKNIGDEFQYIYDFGDYWEHKIIFEKISFLKDDSVLPIEIVDGKNDCAFEDCGGVDIYNDIMAILKDPNHPEHALKKNEYKNELKNHKFDDDFMDMLLTRYFSLGRDRYLKRGF